MRFRSTINLLYFDRQFFHRLITCRLFTTIIINRSINFSCFKIALWNLFEITVSKLKNIWKNFWSRILLKFTEIDESLCKTNAKNRFNSNWLNLKAYFCFNNVEDVTIKQTSSINTKITCIERVFSKSIFAIKMTFFCVWLYCILF